MAESRGAGREPIGGRAALRLDSKDPRGMAARDFRDHLGVAVARFSLERHDEIRERRAIENLRARRRFPERLQLALDLHGVEWALPAVTEAEERIARGIH